MNWKIGKKQDLKCRKIEMYFPEKKLKDKTLPFSFPVPARVCGTVIGCFITVYNGRSNYCKNLFHESMSFP